MLSPRRRSRVFEFVPLAVLVSLAAGLPPATAGKAVLKNKTTIEGDVVRIKGFTRAQIARSNGPTENYPIVLIDAGFKRYFVPRMQVDWASSELIPQPAVPDYFHFKRTLTRRKPLTIPLSGVQALKPWTKFGRRTVRVATPRGKVDVVEGVMKINPKYVEIEAITHHWKHGLAITSIPSNELHAMIYQTIDSKKASDRMAVVRFYILAGRFQRASRELDGLVKDFPAYKKKAKEVRLELRQLTAKQIQEELRRRKAAGQHRLVYQSCLKFPRKDITAAVLKEITSLKKNYDDARKKAERALTLLMDLESKLKNAKQVKAVKPMRSEVRSRLDYESLPRLDAFLKLAGDATLTVDEKLALAYSGWILGSGNANTNLDLTIRQWEARFLAIEYLRTPGGNERKLLLEKIERQEGLKPEHLGQMVPFLPPLVETPEIKPGEPTILTVAGREGKPPIKYAVQLPPEYNRHHVYPAVVTLRPLERSVKTAVQWWGGTVKKPGPAQRRGYIVIAPEYAEGMTGGYDYSSQAHVAVIECLRDACKRFSIDCDRVFLSGHGHGGDAAFDIGMSHPDLFAGVVPIAGICDKYCRYYHLNAKHMPWYIVNGEYCRNSMERNSHQLMRMMGKLPVFDVIYVEYNGRGYESFYGEIHNIFDWMSLHRRLKYPKRFEAGTLRVSDDRFWWMKGSGFPRAVTNSKVLVPRPGGIKPIHFKAWVDASNQVNIDSGAIAHTVWLSPEFIDYSKRVKVLIRGGRTAFRGFIRREIDTMLDDLRIRGDRQKLYWTRLHVDRRFRTTSR